MGKVINTDTPAKRREKIMRLLTTLIQQTDFSEVNETDIKDKTAFIYLSLIEIEKTIAETIRPWEKRDYWIKADKFREEWEWVKELHYMFEDKISNNNWRDFDGVVAHLREKLVDIEPMKRLGNNEFWDGAYSIMQKTSNK